MALQHLRSSTADKRPAPASMSDGQLAINTNLASPGLFFKDSNGDLVKTGPVHVGTTAPNATPASGGTAGNSKGELWLDTTSSDYTLKTWDGSAWREIVVTSTMIKDGTIVNADINASAGIVDTKLATIATAGKVSNSATTATSANTNSTIVARDGSGNFSAGTITANLTGTASAIADNTVTSAKIVDGAIVNADINASAAIAGTKVAPDFGSQNVVTTGTSTAASFIPTGSSVPTNGVYLPAANNVAISTNGTGRLTVDTAATTSTLPVVHPLGAVGTPSITFTGDLDTGIYSPAADTIAFAEGGVEAMRIDSSGRLGLGTSAPSKKLQVDSADFDTALFKRTNSTGSATIFLSNTSNHGAAIQSLGNGEGGFALFTQTSDVITERLRVNNSGNVGIGTTAPASVLSIKGTSGFTYLDSSDVARLSITQATSPDIRFNVATSNYFLNLQSVGASQGAILFTTGTSSGSERARIDSSGRLLVGTSTSQTTNALIQAYKSSGIIYSYVRSDSLANGDECGFWATTGTRSVVLAIRKHAGITNPAPYLNLQEEDGANAIYWTDNSGNFRISSNVDHIGTTSGTVVGTQTSDERLKNILGPVEYGLDEIKQLDPVSYALKSDPEQTPHLGFIAQQVNPIIPESVFDTDEVIEEGESTKLGMEYVALIPVLVNAIKELSAEVDALKAQLQGS
jgi:hypothetical protein